MEALIRGRDEASRRTQPRAAPRLSFCPHVPTPRQQEFLALACREALFGGAAGGGKSEALLMGALQYVHVPGYAALILRKDTQRLQLAGGLVPRSQQWLAGSGARWNQGKLQWRFSTGGAPATLSFGYLQTAADKFRYGSSEFQYIAFDELTEFAEEDYLFLFSRLRNTKDIGVPLRMRAASNPGGPGHAWVKARFVEAERGAESAEAGSAERGKESFHSSSRDPRCPSRVFIPATIADNPHLDAAEYRRSLAHLPGVLRQRLERGDWSIHEAGLIQQQWLRYYARRDRMLELLDAAGRSLACVDERACRRFATADPAGTSADRAAESRGRPASWSVVAVWDQPLARELSQYLLLRHVARQRVGFDGLCALLRQTHRTWRPLKTWIENEKLGQAACDVLRRELPIACIGTLGRDKLTRAAPLIAKLERGEIFLPRAQAPGGTRAAPPDARPADAWLVDLEAEWLAWSGRDDEPADQIDAAAYAVMAVEQNLLRRRVKLIWPPWIA